MNFTKVKTSYLVSFLDEYRGGKVQRQVKPGHVRVLCYLEMGQRLHLLRRSAALQVLHTSTFTSVEVSTEKSMKPFSLEFDHFQIRNYNFPLVLGATFRSPKCEAMYLSLRPCRAPVMLYFFF